MGKILTPRKKKKISVDRRKESIVRELAMALEDAGYGVRREQLKQGHGWKVMSGSCNFKGEDLIFVDRRLSQDDQISFLVSKISSLGIKVDRDKFRETPEKVLNQIS